MSRRALTTLSPAALLAVLRARGLILRPGADPGVLLVTPPPGAALADADRAAIGKHKAALLDELWHEDVAAAGRTLGWPQSSPAWNGTGFDPIPGGRQREGPTNGASEIAKVPEVR